VIQERILVEIVAGSTYLRERFAPRLDLGRLWWVRHGPSGDDETVCCRFILCNKSLLSATHGRVLSATYLQQKTCTLEHSCNIVKMLQELQLCCR